jgi:hypothetical protein
MSLAPGACRCSYCSAPIEPAEANAAREILVCLDDEAFWEVTLAMGPPVLELAVQTEFGFTYNACLDCVTKALFSLVIAPGGHSMLG